MLAMEIVPGPHHLAAVLVTARVVDVLVRHLLHVFLIVLVKNVVLATVVMVNAVPLQMLDVDPVFLIVLVKNVVLAMVVMVNAVPLQMLDVDLLKLVAGQIAAVECARGIPVHTLQMMIVLKAIALAVLVQLVSVV